LIINNSTAGSKGGGGLYECNSEIINCTIVNNSASKGGGIYDTASTAIPYGWPKPPAITPVTNCIIWGNEATEGPQIYLNNRGGIDVNNCDIQGGEADVYIGLESRFGWKTGNIEYDPLFIDATNNDYNLQPGSQCIDAGDSTAIPPSVTTDLNGNPRIINNCIDMGVYEFVP
jgi:phage-related tail fiber protein